MESVANKAMLYQSGDICYQWLTLNRGSGCDLARRRDSTRQKPVWKLSATVPFQSLPPASGTAWNLPSHRRRRLQHFGRCWKQSSSPDHSPPESWTTTL